MEGFTDEAASYVWPQFVGPFEEVHIGVEAACLFQLGSVFVGGVECVSGECLRGEEAEGVVVGAAERL